MPAMLIPPPVFACAAIGLHDADGPIYCSTGEKIRLSGVAARELDGSCRPNQPCPVGDPMKAREALASAIGARIDWAGTTWERLAFTQPVALTCRYLGTSYKRIVATCTTYEGKDVSCLAIESGAAVRWFRYDAAGALARCSPGHRGWLARMLASAR